MKRSKWCKYCERGLTPICPFQKIEGLCFEMSDSFERHRIWIKLQNYRDWLAKEIKKVKPHCEEGMFSQHLLNVLRKCAKQLRK